MPTEHRVYTDYAPLTSSEHTQLTRNVKLILCGKVPGRRRCPLDRGLDKDGFNARYANPHKVDVCLIVSWIHALKFNFVEILSKKLISLHT